jgi:hypothetical protein
LNSAQVILKARIVSCSSILTQRQPSQKNLSAVTLVGIVAFMLQNGADAFFGRRISGFDPLVFPNPPRSQWLTVARFAQSTIV